jgi:hypothetical protein
LDRSVRASWVFGLVAVAVALTVSVTSLVPVRAEDRRSNAAGTFTYHPAGAGGQPELCDTRTGTIYRRNLSGSWEVASKFPD